jgi:hypothetical protein
MGITEDLFNAARECVTRGESPASRTKLGAARQRAIATGLKSAQIQTIEIAAKKAASLQSKFGRERRRA